MSSYQCDFLLVLRGKALAVGSTEREARKYCSSQLRPEVLEQLLGCKDIEVLTLELSEAIELKEV